MFFAGIIFPRSDRDALFTGKKSAIIVEGFISLMIGAEYPVYVSNMENPFKDSTETKVGTASVLSVTHKKMNCLTEQEIALAYDDLPEIINRRRENRSVFYESGEVTFISFDMSFEWPLVKRLVGGPEIKFVITADNMKTIEKAAHLIDERSVIDTYYDKSLKLAKKNWWLKHRGNVGWQLMIPESNGKFRKISEEEIIKSYIRLKSLDTVPLIEAGYGAGFATILSDKAAYRMGDYLIETDTANMLENDPYSVGVISPLVVRENPAEVERKIRDFCENNGFIPGNPRRKIIEYLRVTQPETYKALIGAVVPE